MDDEMVQTIVAVTGDQEIRIYRRPNNTFYFEEWIFSDAPMENCWFPAQRTSIGVYDSAETALREAKGLVSWLGTKDTESDS